MVDRIAPATGDRERAITPRRVRHRRRLAGVLRGLHPVGGRGPLPRRPPGARGGRRPVRRRRHPVRAHEDPHPERRPRASSPIPPASWTSTSSTRAWRDPLVRAFLQQGRARGDHPDPAPGPRHRPRRLLRSSIVRRCDNPKIGDTIRRLCLDGSNRQPKFIIPSIADRLDRGLPVDGLALESALWCRYCYGTTDSGAGHRAERPELGPPAGAGPRRQGRPRRLARACATSTAAPPTPPPSATPSPPGSRALWSDGTAATLRRYLAGGR